MFHRALGKLHQLLGRYRVVATAARYVGSQADAIVGSYCSEIEGENSSNNKWRANEFSIIDHIAPHSINFIDVGANEGWWSSYFVSKMTREPVGLIFEPSSESLKLLHSDFDDLSGIKVVAAAISDHIGKATFYENKTNQRRSSVHQLHDASDVIHAHTVPVTTLDREVNALGWEKVSFVKIDAEGEDFNCLRGARGLLSEKRIDFIQFEYNSEWRGISIAAAESFLKELGYELFQIHPKGLRQMDIDFFGTCGSGNWLAFHPGAPEVGLNILY